MNLRPPFPADLTPEDEIARFELLKPRLDEVWQALVDRDEEPYTSVVVPSLTLDQSELRKLPGASFYEERLLFLLIRLRNPRARMVFVTSQPVHPFVLEYYFQFLAGIPASHARARLTLLCAHDASPRSLTEKILERPRLLQRIRDGIDDTRRAYLTVFNSTPLERRLAVLLGIPLNGVDPNLIHLGTKSGSRKVFREAGVDLPAGNGGRAHGARRGERAAGPARPAARPAARGGQAQRQLLRRGERDLPLPARSQRGRRSTTSCAPSSSRCRRRRRSLYFEKLAPDGRHRRGVHRGAGEGLAQRAAAHQPHGRGATHLDPRPDPRRDQRAGLPRVQSSPPTRATACACRKRRSRSARCWPATAWSAASAWTSSSGAPVPRRSGRSPRWRSTCAWAAPPTPTSPCSS